MQQLSRRYAPWHLWLDKYSFPWAVRCNVAAEHWRQQAKEAKTDGDHQKEKEFKQKSDSIPSGKTSALIIASTLAKHGSMWPYCERTLRWLDKLQRQHRNRFVTVDLLAESRLLLHLGRANVLENVGLYAEHTTGLPIIPGSALKGVISTWACWSEYFNDSDGSFRKITKESAQRSNFNSHSQLARLILGDNKDSGSDQAGEIIFLGGYPMTPPQLGIDIVNPHHEIDGRAKQKLNPNTFLCIEPGIQWRFAFYARPGVPEVDRLLQQTRVWIEESLTQTGIGAKTAAGYGRFRFLTEEDQEVQKQLVASGIKAELLRVSKKAVDTPQGNKAPSLPPSLNSDYPNAATFKNRVIAKLAAHLLDQLKLEVPCLEKPENELFRNELKKLLASRDYKDIRKRLRDKDWFPKDWLPV